MALLPGRLGRRVAAADEDTQDAVIPTASRQALGANRLTPVDTPPAEEITVRFGAVREGDVEDNGGRRGSEGGGGSKGGVSGGGFRT